MQCLRAGPRQRQILALLACGLSDSETAIRLGISVATVRSYLIRLYRDNGFNNRTEAVAVWLQSGGQPALNNGRGPSVANGAPESGTAAGRKQAG